MTIMPDVDVMIGARLRERRKMLGLSQADLADKLGVSYQQIQRYEAGENALSIARLYEIAACLNCTVDFFTKDLKPNTVRDEDQITRDKTRRLRMTLVEDSPSDEILFRTALGRTSHPVDLLCVRDATGLMDIMRQNGGFKPDLIVMDINLPRKSGLDILIDLKKQSALRAIPVVMLTHSLRATEMQRAYTEGAAGFIQKQSDFDAFCRDIDVLITYWHDVALLPLAS